MPNGDDFSALASGSTACQLAKLQQAHQEKLVGMTLTGRRSQKCGLMSIHNWRMS